MKGIPVVIAAIISVGTVGAKPQGDNAQLTNIIEQLETNANRNVSAKFTVSMPQLADDVVYEVDLYQMEAEGDTLSPVSYLIDWQMERDGDKAPVSGFSSYFEGNLYRLNSEKFQEYHFSQEPSPFTSAKGGKKNGVHLTAQFVNLLPAMIAEELREAATNGDYSFVAHEDTIVGGRRLNGLDVVMTYKGNVVSEREYLFDPESGLPVRMHFENNPGSISEQTVDVVYAPVSEPLLSEGERLSEDRLMELYPEAFTTMRQSLFRAESLVGKEMPGFEAPTLNGERYIHNFHDKFATPTLIMLCDHTSGFTAKALANAREGLEQLPFATVLLPVFVANNAESVSEAIEVGAGETVLIGGKAMARDCGVTAFPTMITVDRNGIVTDVTVGFNNNITSDVIQKMSYAAGR